MVTVNDIGNPKWLLALIATFAIYRQAAYTMNNDAIMVHSDFGPFKWVWGSTVNSLHWPMYSVIVGSFV